MKMFKRITNYVFLMAIYLSGILIGGIYTPDVIHYAKQFNASENAEQQQEQVKQKQQNKKKTKTSKTNLA